MQTWVTLEIHAVFEKKAECFDMKLGLAIGKKRSTVGINNGQMSYRNIENVTRERIVMYLKGQPLYTYLLALQTYRLNMLICSHPRIHNVHKEKQQ